jgi:hypothetical protein
LLAGAALPASVSAFAQCVTDTMVVDACLGGVRRTVPSGMTFERNFMTGSLGTGAVFTRASTGTYTNASGVLVSAAINAPRFDYDPVTLQLKGLLLEDASTNICLAGADLANALWPTFGSGVAAPTVTGNNAVAPDGTTTAARIVYPAVTAGASSVIYQTMTLAASSYSLSIWLRGSVGGEQVYLIASTGGTTFLNSPRLTLTTQWQRFSFLFTGTAAGWAMELGCDLRGGTQAVTPAQTIYAWGGQVETNFMSSYIPTLSAAVTRAGDVLSYPIASVTGFDATKGTLVHEYILEGTPVGFSAPAALVGANVNADLIIPDGYANGTVTAPVLNRAGVIASSAGHTAVYDAAPSVPSGPVHKGAVSWATGVVVSGAHDGAPTTSNDGVVPVLPVIANLLIAGAVAFQAPVSQWARRTRYWPRQLSQAELISVTT